MMKKTLAMLLALCMMLSLVACGGSSDDTADAVQSLSVCLASEPDTLDPAMNSSVDGAIMILHMFSGFAKWVQDGDSYALAADIVEELVEGVTNEDGSITYTYTLKDAVWSDGEPVTAGDFEYSWKRAASSDLGGDYCGMFAVIKGWSEELAADSDDLAVKALDDKTLEVTLTAPVPYWDELLAFPTYMPVREDVVADEGWATDPSTFVCNGMYTMTAWEHDSVITLTKNEDHYDADLVTMPVLKCYLSDDSNNMLANFKKGDWQLIDDVPSNEIKSLEKDYPNEFVIAPQIGIYYVCWNVNQNLLPASSTLEGMAAAEANAEIRNALSLLLDRNYICDSISQCGELPASSFVGRGISDYDKSEFAANAGFSDEFEGYFNVSEDAVESNFEEAITILKKYYTYDEATGMFTDMPTIEYLYNTSDSHKAIGEYIQTAFAGVGMSIQLVNQEWNTFLNTRKTGDYGMARNGWVADYNDPISFLDMWTSYSGNNDIQFGKGDHETAAYYSLDLTAYGIDVNVTNGTWSETFDALIDEIKKCTDDEARYEMMHMAEDMLMDTGCITPIYSYTDTYMIDDSVEGFFSIPLGYKYFMYTTIAE